MKQPGWMKWVRPAPKDADEKRLFSALVDALVADTKEVFSLRSEVAELRESVLEQEDQYRRIQNAIAPLDALPAILRTHPSFVLIRDALLGISNIPREPVLSTTPTAGRGRPIDCGKSRVVHFLLLILYLHGKAATLGRAGTLVGLASWVWKEATTEYSSSDAWAGTIKRELARLNEAQVALNQRK